MPVVKPENPNELPKDHNLRTTAGVLAELDLIVAIHNETRTLKLSRNDLILECIKEGVAAEWAALGRKKPEDPISELARYQKNHKK